MRRRYRVSVLSQFAFDDDVLLSGDLLGSSGSVNPDMPTLGAPAYVVGSQSSRASAPRQECLRAYGLCCGVEAFGDTLGGPGFADEGIGSDGSVACWGSKWPIRATTTAPWRAKHSSTSAPTRSGLSPHPLAMRLDLRAKHGHRSRGARCGKRASDRPRAGQGVYSGECGFASKPRGA